jgi:membrane-associated protease RseP (regulator of RpoE activity)
MLDERESEVAPEEAHRSFNRLTPLWRIAIALGGPLANFLLAIVVYWGLFVAGSTDFVPIIDEPAPETPAYAAGLRGGEEIVAIDDVATPPAPRLQRAAARLGPGVIHVTTRSRRRHHAEHRLDRRVVVCGDEPTCSSPGAAPDVTTVGNVLPDGLAAAGSSLGIGSSRSMARPSRAGPSGWKPFERCRGSAPTWW